MNRKCIKVIEKNNYKGLCIRHTFVKREKSYFKAMILMNVKVLRVG